MRLRALAFAAAAFLLAAFGAWEAGGRVAERAEARAEAALATSLGAAGLDWAEARADGLVVRLGGQAPDETARFRAVEIARATLDFGRIEDRIAVARADPAEPPAFALEILRSDSEVSLIGLVPEPARAAIATRLAASGIGATVTDMLEAIDHPAPPGWENALAFGLDALAALPRAQIGIAPGSVSIAATADDEPARAALERDLADRAPEGIALALDIGAPRPVIAPFAVTFRRDDGGAAALAACSAETEAEAEAIIAAARAAGARDPECRIGLGAPSPDWTATAVAGIEAVAALRAGSFALADLDAFLVAPPSVAPEDLAQEAAALERDLAAPFTLVTRAETPASGDDDAPGAAPEFRAALAADGTVRLTGPLADATSRIAVTGFARSVFGHARVIDATVLRDGLPEGWPGRILAGIEALALIEEGALVVTREALALEGRSLHEAAGHEIEAFVGDRAGGPLLVDVAFDAEAAAALEAERAAEARRARDAACAAEVEALLEDEMILFEPGSASIEAESVDVVDRIGRALAACPGARFEVAGHTDSQGGEALNQTLSETRASAVVEALAASGAELVAKGYGPDRPIADNGTAEGRALNRRIEFALLSEEAPESPTATGPHPETPGPEAPAPEPAPEPTDTAEQDGAGDALEAGAVETGAAADDGSGDGQD